MTLFSCVQDRAYHHTPYRSDRGRVPGIPVWEACAGHPHWHELVRRGFERGQYKTWPWCNTCLHAAWGFRIRIDAQLVIMNLMDLMDYMSSWLSGGCSCYHSLVQIWSFTEYCWNVDEYSFKQLTNIQSYLHVHFWRYLFETKRSCCPYIAERHKTTFTHSRMS